ncbi:hypothetical protein, conserved [Babesia bigemina]|uniref:C3H1-type domain-containing protein n=1 Tax=Babesia bigemina TaxID=5866 RepID=A0A061BQH2_BABBI|nr:hypothetical protein, conserved [Babesia bigemina]CDR71718.1 hypothetical protein, conserved [Babesia bigemina]|eukprot:XP_012770664.1 hypothetical protein, conserved [Babesia bigemina]
MTDDGDKVKLDSGKFEKYLSGVNTTSLGTNKPALTGDSGEGTVPVTIKKIENDVTGDDNYLKDVENETTADPNKFNQNTFSTLLEAVTNNLDAFCKNIMKLADGTKGGAPNGTDGIKQKLHNLSELLGDKLEVDVSSHEKVKGLEKTYNDLLTLLGVDLRNIIDATEKFINKDAPELQQDCVEAIHNHVNVYFGYTQLSLTTAARRNYVSSVKALLTAFADKVSQELRGLPEEIERDLRIGFKGLMKTLEDGSTSAKITGKQNIKKLSDLVTELTGGSVNHKTAFENFSDKFKDFAEPLFLYLSKEAQRVHSENNAKKNPRGTDLQHYSDHISKIHDAFNSLLDDLHKKHRYDYKVHNLLDNLSDAVRLLVPKGFAQPNSPVIDGLTSGVTHFVGELERVYISAYDSQKCGELIKDYKQEATLRGVFEKYELTEEGRDCAKVCLSVIPIVYNELMDLKNKFDDDDNTWKTYKIYNSLQPDQSLHKLFFGDNGYDVGLSHDAKHGELNHKERYNGQCILDVLNSETHKLFEDNKQPLSPAAPGVGDSEEPEVHLVDEGAIAKLYNYLKNYFVVCHLIGHAKSRHPCSVYEMLCWLTGLPHNTAYKKLKEHIGSLFLVADKDNPSKKIPKPILTSHSSITASNVLTAVEEICATSYAVLTAVVGTGDAATHYACELPNNSSRLIYPTNGADCLDTLLDILRRIFPVLQFLHAQCQLKTKHYGWYNCEYGRDIRPTKWPCNEHTKESTKEPTKCLPKSPLQSYLNDCLPGHLPHQLSSIGCKAECNTCPKKPDGRPCLTPMGFRGFSGSTKTGKNLCSVLSKFFSILHVNSLVCLIPKPPSTLSEHFGFALSLVEGWHTWRDTGSINPLQAAMEDHISAVSMELVKRGDATNALRLAYGSNQANHFKHDKDSTDLCSLSMKMICSGRNANCAPYISTLCTYLYDYLAYKNCNLYLSWAIYLPWTFWDLLNNLYNAFCSINCKDWGCRGCLRGDKCKKGEHGVIEDEKKPNPTCQCRSIVDCRGVAPTLYQYGFVFGEASTLNDKQSPKKCSDFCSQLKNVLKSKYFEKLFAECDMFLWRIREPFYYLVLTLWLLSLLYLLHIMVVRLDLLHIKSHLHSPSSHRIAAQSLLAAARVNKLGRVFYLQP